MRIFADVLMVQASLLAGLFASVGLAFADGPFAERPNGVAIVLGHDRTMGQCRLATGGGVHRRFLPQWVLHLWSVLSRTIQGPDRFSGSLPELFDIRLRQRIFAWATCRSRALR